MRGCKTGKQTAYLLSSSLFFRQEGWTPIIICEDFHFPCDLQGKCKDQPFFQFLAPSLNFYSRNALTFSDILDVRFTVLRAHPEGLRSAKSCPIALLPCDDDDGIILCKHHSRHSFSPLSSNTVVRRLIVHLKSMFASVHVMICL